MYVKKLYIRKMRYCYKLFSKIVNNPQHFSPFCTYFTIHISFFLKFIVHFYRPLTALPFLQKRFALSALFSIISGKTAGKNRENFLECSVVLC